MGEPVSLHDELSTAIDASEATNDTTTSAPDESTIGTGELAAMEGSTPVVEVDDTSARTAAERARDEKGRFTKAVEGDAPTLNDPNAAPADPEDQATEAEQVPAAQIDLPPSTWTPEAKAEYLHLSPTIRGEIKKREADFQRGINQYKELASHGDSLMKVISPYMPMIQSEGSDAQRAVGNLLNTAYRLRTGSPTERGQLVMALAQQYGADISPWVGQQAQQGQQGGVDQMALQRYVDQLVAQRTAPLQQLQQQQMAQVQAQEAAATQATQSQIEQFRTAVDEKGQPAHIYFDNVRALMATLIENGNASTLDEAYATACRAHPEVAKAMAAEQQLGAGARRLEEAKKKADDARRAAAANITGQGGIGVADSSKLTLHDELSRHFDRTATV